ncbi:MAG: hypothetical protein K2K15_06445, partial [Anaeroplasmataceae bacterium]|nr:hypothetical protein [Anaeroplasmataceae bacterium]
FEVKKIKVPIPIVGSGNAYTGEAQEVYVAHSSQGLYKLYLAVYTLYSADGQQLQSAALEEMNEKAQLEILMRLFDPTTSKQTSNENSVIVYTFQNEDGTYHTLTFTEQDSFKYKDIGKYYLFAILTDYDNYEWDDPRDQYYHSEITQLTATITEREATIRIPEHYQTQYTGGEITFSVNGTSPFEVANLLPGHTMEAEFSFTPDVAGIYDFKNFIVKNYRILDEDGQDVTNLYIVNISGQMEVVYPEASYEVTYYEGPYDGQYHDFIVVPNNPDLLVEYSGNNREFQNIDIRYINAGTYTYYFRISGEKTETTYGSVTFTVDKIDATIEILTKETSKEYDGLPFDVQFAVGGSTGAQSIKYFIGGVAYDQAINAGHYVAEIRVARDASGNYNDTVNRTFEFDILKKDITISVSANKDYDGNIYSDTVLINHPDLSSNLTMGVILNTNSSNAGIYRVSDGNLSAVVQILNDKNNQVTTNFNIIIDYIEVEIYKVDATFVMDELDFTYYPNTPIILPAIVSTAENYTISYIYPDGTKRSETPINSGEYTLVLESTETANTNATVFERVFEIKKYKLVTSILSSDVIYTGAVTIPQVQIFLNPENVELTGTPAGQDLINVTGEQLVVTYEIPAEFRNNYELATDTFNYQIVRREITVRYQVKHVLYTVDELNIPVPHSAAITEDLILNSTGIDIVSGTITTRKGNMGVYSSNKDFIVDIDFVNPAGESTLNNYVVKVDSYVAIRYPLFFAELDVQENDTYSCDDEGNETITRDYTGKSYIPSIHITNEEAPSHTITYSLDGREYRPTVSATSAGTYTVYYKVTGSRYETLEGSFTLVINRVQFSLVAEQDLVYVYNGSPVRLIYSIIPDEIVHYDPIILYEYDNRDKEIPSIGTIYDAPMLVGKYCAKIRLANTPNYDGFEELVYFSIVKGDANIQINSNYKTHIYTGESVALPSHTSLISNSTTTYTYEQFVNGEWIAWTETPEYPRPYNVGKYRVIVTVEANDDYDTSFGSMEFDIVPLEIRISWDTTPMIYNGTLQYPTATATDLNGDALEIQYNIDNNSINADTYTISASLSNTNYAIENADHEYTIAKRAIYITEKDSHYVCEDGKPWSTSYVTSDVEGIAEKDEFSATLSTVSADLRLYFEITDFVWEMTLVDKTTKEDVSENYEFIFEVYIFIKEKPIRFEFTDLVVPYNGQPQSPTINWITEDVTEQYVLFDGTLLDEMPQYTSAGTYTIHYVFTKDGYETEDGTVDFTIEKIAPVIEIEAESKEFDGKDVHIVSTGNEVSRDSASIDAIYTLIKGTPAEHIINIVEADSAPLLISSDT